MKLIIAGASGYIGRRLVRQAAAEGHGILSLVRKPDEALKPYGTQANYLDALPDSHLGADALISVAGLAHAHAGDSEFDSANRRLPLEVARHVADGNIGRLVHVSTLGVYGSWSASPVSEGSRLAPETPYARSKLEGDRALASFLAASPESLTIVRPPMVYGPRCPGNFSRLRRLVARGWPLPFGSARAKRSFIYVDNLVDFLLRCTPSASPSGLYVIGDGSDYSVGELVSAMAFADGVRFCNLPVPCALLRAVGRLAGRRRDMDSLTRPMVVDWTRAREALKWFPLVDADEAMSRALAV